MRGQRYLIHLVSGNTWGGIQTYACDICRHYAEHGWHVSVLTCGARIVDTHFENAGILTEAAPLRGFFDIESVRELAAMLRQQPAEAVSVIHVHRYRDALTAIIARSVAKRPGVRIISSRHAVRIGRDTLLFRFIYRRLQGHIFVSKAAYERFCRSWPGRHLPLDPQQTHVLYDSLNLPAEKPVPEPERGPVTALYFGSIVPGKGIDTLLDAFALLRGKKIRLLICGRGNPDFLDMLRRRAQNLGVMDMIDWNTRSDDYDTALRRTHFCVVPSVECEAFGLANMRSMAAGRAQVATDSGAQVEYLEDGVTAIVVKPGDAPQLADAIERLATDKSLRRELGTNALRKFKDDLDWPQFIEKLNRIYEPTEGKE